MGSEKKLIKCPQQAEAAESHIQAKGAERFSRTGPAAVIEVRHLDRERSSEVMGLCPVGGRETVRTCVWVEVDTEGNPSQNGFSWRL